MLESMNILIIAGVILVAMIVIGIILSRLYTRASKEISFVRTGFGGQKVILNGGALVLPVLHDVIPVNMNTLRLEVARRNEQALITKDRMRVDVASEFYVRVKPEEVSIANAAQTLGQKTIHPEELKDLVEGKFVDALRAVAAEMTMEELHEKRVDFVQKVQQAVMEDLFKNGLELESVSLTGLDQTSKEFFNPNNAFDAQGLTRLTEEIEERRKIRNDIEQETNVAIAQKNLEAKQRQLKIQQDEEQATLNQQQEIETLRAAQETEIARRRADQQRTSQEADIQSKRDIQAAEIEKQKAIELAEQERTIAIAKKSEEQSEAKAKADEARAKAVQAEESVITVKETAEAERRKAIQVIKAKEAAEQDAIGITVAAEAEKQAAKDKAEATRTLANAEAEKQKITADGEAEATKLRAEAQRLEYNVEAEGKQAVNEAANLLSPEQVEMQIRLALINQAAAIIEASVKPLESIDGIKIIQVDGLTGGSAGAGCGSSNSGGSNLGDQLVNSALRYRGQAPLVDSLLKEIGLDSGDINSMHGLVKQSVEPSTVKEVSTTSDNKPPIDTASAESDISEQVVAEEEV